MEPSRETRSGQAAALLEALRVPHWVKNLLVLAPLAFSGKAGEPLAWVMSLGAFGAFCLLSSAVYLINDLADRTSDRAHPQKCRRPIASGRLNASLAAVAAAILLAGGGAAIAGLSWMLRQWPLPLAPAVASDSLHAAAQHAEVDPAVHWVGLGVWAGAYVVVNLAYSLGLKDRPILDVLLVAFGFVLRAMAGAAAVAAVVSPWLVVCTLMLCLFVALAKRRGEIAELGPSAGQTRRVNRFYSLANLDHMLAVSAGLAILTYSLYCLAPGTIARVGSAHLIWTIPIVVYGMFRYYCLTLAGSGQDPVGIVFRDKVLWLTGAAWVACVAAALKWGSQPPFADLLLH